MGCSQKLQLHLPFGSLWYNANSAPLYTHINSSLPTISRNVPNKLRLVQNVWSRLRRSVPKQRRQQRNDAISEHNSFRVNPSLCVLKVCVESGSTLMNGVPVLGAGGERGEAHGGHI